MSKEEVCIIGISYHYVEIETHNNDEFEIVRDYKKGDYKENAPLKVHDRFPVYAERSYIPGTNALVTPIVGLYGVFDNIGRDGTDMYEDGSTRPLLRNSEAKRKIAYRVASVLGKLGQVDYMYTLLCAYKEKTLKELLEYIEKDFGVKLYIDDETREILEERNLVPQVS